MRTIWQRIRHVFGIHYMEKEYDQKHEDGFGYTKICNFCNALGGWIEPPVGYPVRLH